MAITFVNSGAAAAANNASVVPTLPASLANGDLLLIYATARASSGFTTPTGYNSVLSFSNPAGFNTIRIFWRIRDGTEVNPTVPFTGSAGQTVIAQMAAFRGISSVPVFQLGPSTRSVVSAQNIGPTAAFQPLASDCLILALGHKADDWTSVATLAGDVTWVEIGEPDSTLGNDAGMVWNYAIVAGAPPAIAAKTFTVTGGAVQSWLTGMLTVDPVSFSPQMIRY